MTLNKSGIRTLNKSESYIFNLNELIFQKLEEKEN